MSAPIAFDGVWKKFSSGERHDSLRDLIPALFRRAMNGPPEGLTAREFWAVKEVSFEVCAGEALGIIGRNGAGKSTILKLLSRILKPTRGHARVTGRVGALIEVAAGFHPDLTGRENIFLQGAIMGMKRGDIARRFDQIVDFAGVDRFVDTPVKRYSSGMSARLGFSIAAHLDPDVLLIDEVLAVGDLAFQEKCQARMADFLAEGAAIVFVSHHLPSVVRLCTRTLLLEQGEVARLGAPADVIAAYCRGDAIDTTGEVSVSATLGFADSSSEHDVFSVPPGAPLTLDVTTAFRVDVRHATVGVVVWDVTRELYVYGASSDFVGIPPIQARRGDIRTFEFTFDANLTRGLYAIEVNVFDCDRQHFLAMSRGIRHFNVAERISYDGVANLYLNGRDVACAARAS
ncbi:MAG TPA: ABC transporter ATP-binding protein [Vicinamibacterales bacterium]|nr:ABC transporter ATP-binding protein [Vicinamibacterales bacterium]